jgi:hypothetical protein
MNDIDTAAGTLPVTQRPSISQPRPLAEQVVALCSTPVTGTALLLAGLPLWVVLASVVLSALWLVYCRGASHAREWSDTLKHIHDTWRPPDGGPGP